MAWNQSTGEAAKPQPKKPSAMRGVIAGFVVVAVVAGVAIFCMFRKSVYIEEVPLEINPGLIKEVKPAAAPKAVVEESPEEADRKRRAKLAKMTPQERREATMKEIIKKPLDLSPASNRVFKTGVEQQIALIFTTQPGNPPPFLTKMSIREEAHLAEILMNRVDPNEKDSEKIKEAKAVVEMAKKELRKYIKEGGEVQDFLAYYHGQLKQAFHERNEAQKSVFEVINNSPDIAADYIKKVNEQLDKKGIKHVTVPPHMAERIGYKND